MKKVIFSAATMLSLVACGGGNDPAKDAQEVCDCFLKANKLEANDPNRVQQQTECLQKQVEVWNKYKENAEESAKFNETLSKCNDEVINQAFGK